MSFPNNRRVLLALLFGLCACTVSRAENRLLDEEIDSKVMSKPIEYAVLLPDGYESAKEPLPLLLLLHGGGGNKDSLKRQRVPVEQAWNAKTLPPMVVVTPSCGRGFYMDFKNGSQKWETFLVSEFLDHLRQKYNVRKDRQGTLLFGVSMGGMGGLRLSFKYPDKFGGVAALEPGIDPAFNWKDVKPRNRFWRSDELMESIYGKPLDEAYWGANNPATIARDRPDKLRSAGLAIYLDAGDDDSYNLDEATEFLHRVLWDNEIPHEYHLVRGADHTGRTLGARSREGLEFLATVINPPPADPAAQDLKDRLAPQKKQWGVQP